MNRFSAFAVIVAASSTAFAQWKPAGNNLKTMWGERLKPEAAWQEYPRPIMERADWQNLNGLWDYAILNEGSAEPREFDGKILVPFCVESSLSGVQRDFGEDRELWYHRQFQVPSNWTGKRVLLHFEAVDWRADVYVNDILIGSHSGGYTPFAFDVTDVLKASGAQKLVVKVWDPTDAWFQPSGKQRRHPSLIWYTAVSGIWQTVWLEPVEKDHLDAVIAEADIDAKTLTVKAETTSLQGTIQAVLKDDGDVVARGEGAAGTGVVLTVPKPKLWEVKTPFLYDLEVTLSHGGRETDRVKSYAAMRKISTHRDDHGYLRIQLNNKSIFSFGPLDQGWWPDGLYTPPSDEAMRFDIDKTKAWGFNTIRKHMKVEPARWYTYCDQVGLLVWQDMPSSDAYPKWEPFKLNGGNEVKRNPESEAIYRKEWKEIIDHLRPYPCVAVWTPFNESWGQFKTIEIANWTKQYDPSRLVDPASGGNHRNCGDFLDIHHYPDPAMPLHDPDRVNVIGEFGGILLTEKDHLWKADRGHYWDSHKYTNEPEITRTYVQYVNQLATLIPQGVSGAIYTQTTDVEVEVNGLMTYDRKHLKFDQSAIEAVNEKVSHWFDEKP